MMQIINIINEIILAICSTGIILLFGRLFQQRRFSFIIVLMFVFILGVIAFRPLVTLFQYNIDSIFALVVVACCLIIISIFFIVTDPAKRNMMNLYKLFRSEIAKDINGWSTKYKALTHLRIKRLPNLYLSDNYKTSMLSEINISKSLKKEIAIFHIVHRVEYISWVDVCYWCYLRKLSSLGFQVIVYSIDEHHFSDQYKKYLRFFLGDLVEYDSESFDRISTINNDVKASNEEFWYRKIMYTSILMPFILNRKHVLILLWEEYYEKYIQAKNVSNNSVEVSFSNGKASEMLLDTTGVRAGYLLFPTAYGYGVNGKKNYKPSETLLIGFMTEMDVIEKLPELTNSHLNLIFFVIIFPNINRIEFLFYRILVKLLLLIRDDPSLDMKHSKNKHIDKLLSRIYRYLNIKLAYTVGNAK